LTCKNGWSWRCIVRNPVGWLWVYVCAWRVVSRLVLYLLIDTSVWLDMATRRDGQKWIVPLRVLKSQGKVELLVPALIIEEFDRNRSRSESAVTTSVLDRLRQLRRELREYAGEKHEHIWLAETAQHIPLVNATAPQNFREIAELLRDGTVLEPAESEYARSVQRGLDKRAPFTSDKNSVADALLVETYATQISGTASSPDVYVFVTSNYRDFSLPNGDHRQPHPDLAGLFDGNRSRFAYLVDGLHEVLLEQFGDEYLEEQNEVEFLNSEEEPRTLAEILEAEEEFFDKVWYVRSIVRDGDEPELPDDIHAGMMASRERVEAKYGRDELWEPIGPGHDEAWQYGYINGKLATLRWVLGSEWDFLDT
jgi:hypothetical protein